MYAKFNLIINKSNEPDLYELMCSYKSLGISRFQTINSKLKPALQDYINQGIINGSDLSDNWFPLVRSDVFLSYSHNDKEIAMGVAGFLEEEFDLNVFIDEMFWGSADDLLKEIDNRFCLKDETMSTYDYNMRNLSTSHVHAMLSTAIIKEMDETEALIFINTDSSIPKVETSIGNSYTGSPWIFEELIFAFLLRKKNLAESRVSKDFLKHSLSVEYKVPLSEMTDICLKTLLLWKEKYQECRNEPYNGLFNPGCDHVLNVLYELVFTKEELNF